jgi:uncharacterized repeat protein (TIGR01451 family)
MRTSVGAPFVAAFIISLITAGCGGGGGGGGSTSGLLVGTSTGTSTGTQATFSIRTRNLGPASAAGVVVTETLNSKLTFVSAPAGCTYTASSRLVRCTIDTIAAGAEVTTTVVTSYRQKGNIANVVQATATTPDIVTGNNSNSFTLKLR